MSRLFHSARVFWSVALVSAALVLFLSVQLGNAVAAHILAKGTAAGTLTSHKALPMPQRPPVAEVVGGQPYTPSSL